MGCGERVGGCDGGGIQVGWRVEKMGLCEGQQGCMVRWGDVEKNEVTLS